MSLLEQKVFLFDCQTTGTRPGEDRLLELAWSWTSALDSFPPKIESALLQLPEGEELPKRVREITGIADLRAARPPAEVWREFHRDSETGAGIALAHYAQFERGFLRAFYFEHGAGAVFPLPDFCTYRISKRLFPEAPSGNIRGLAGYLGFEFGEIRRAGEHVLATAVIWQRVASELHRLGVHSPAELTAWLKAKAPGKSVQTTFRVDRLKRLALPKGPGIYRMLAKNGEILYVGKATSLHARVNSYFRGGCNGDRRKLEMLARVWDVEVVESATPLEAALLENEEIKRRRPYYNRALRPSEKALVYFSRDFRKISLGRSADQPLGPFREGSVVQQLGQFLLAGADGSGPIFHDYIPEELLASGFALFLERMSMADAGMRKLLALGLWLSRLEEEEGEPEKSEAEGEDLGEEEADEVPLSDEDVAERFQGLVVRAGLEYLRARRLARLANARVSWRSKGGEWRELWVENGRILGLNDSPGDGDLGPDDYDRLSVLYSELRKYSRRIDAL